MNELHQKERLLKELCRCRLVSESPLHESIRASILSSVTGIVEGISTIKFLRKDKFSPFD